LKGSEELPNVTSTQELYDRLWRAGIEQGHADFGDLDMTLRFLDLVQSPRSSDAVLEIGCGTGALCEALRERGCRNLIGVDVSMSAVEFGKTNFPHLDLRCMNAEALDFPDASFDVCLSFDVVEHLSCVSRHFEDVHRILKNDGAYLLQTPNLYSNAVFETVTHRGFGWREIHCSLQTHRSLRRHLRAAGFASVRFFRVPLMLGHKEQVLPAPIRNIYMRIPWQRLPLAFQTNYYVVAQKRA
jgi:2-polyprenyl-3-methyl-5-hydroxy-6-metoxy-1,4-benzoquinol methylase